MSFLHKLDARLQKDAAIVAENPSMWILLKNEAQYPWFLVVPKTAVQSLDLLDLDEQTAILHAVGVCSRIIREHFGRDKVNIASLGNVVPALHIHILGRIQSDPLWPESIWQKAYKPSYLPMDAFHVRVEFVRTIFAEGLSN